MSPLDTSTRLTSPGEARQAIAQNRLPVVEEPYRPRHLRGEDQEAPPPGDTRVPPIRARVPIVAIARVAPMPCPPPEQPEAPGEQTARLRPRWPSALRIPVLLARFRSNEPSDQRVRG